MHVLSGNTKPDLTRLALVTLTSNIPSHNAIVRNSVHRVFMWGLAKAVHKSG